MQNIFRSNRASYQHKLIAWLLAFSLVVQGSSFVPLVAFADTESVVAEDTPVAQVVAEDTQPETSSPASEEGPTSSEVTQSEPVDNSTIDATITDPSTEDASSDKGHSDDTETSNTDDLDALKGLFLAVGGDDPMDDNSSDPVDTSDDIEVSTSVEMSSMMLAGAAVSDNQDDDHKVEICHIPKGEPENARTIVVDKHSVGFLKHLKHGDKVGACEPVTPPEIVETPETPTHTTPDISHLSCEQVTGEGWYAEYFNYSRTDSEMNLPQAQWGSGHADPKGALWASDWYDASHYRFDRIDANLMFGNDFFPFDGARAEELDQNGSGDTHDYHFGAKWSGYAHVETPGDYGITLTSDDDAWVYLDGVLVLDNGGIHAAKTKTATLALTGKNKVEIYFAERHITRSHMHFSFTTQGVTITPAKDGCDTPPPPTETACPFTASEHAYVVDFGMSKFIRSDSTHADANVTKPFEVPVGEYDVTLYSYDDHKSGDATQPRESWYLRLNDSAGLVVASGAISDLANNERTKQETVGAVTLSRPVTSAMAKHAAWPDTTSTNSVYPICAELKKKSPPPPPTNTPPEITVIGANPLDIVIGSVYADQGASALDAEDGNITSSIVTTGSVNTSVLGTYTMFYNVADSKGLPATEKTRIVNVVPAPECKAPLDVVVVLDRSGSMNDDGSNPEQPLTDAKGGANAFIDTLSSSRDRAGVVTYSTTATLNSTLSSNFTAVKASYTGVTANGFTNTGSAITIAKNELVTNGRADAKKVMVLLSDGLPNVSGMSQSAAIADAIAKANTAKGAGIVIYTIGLGDEVNGTVLTQVATSPSHYFFAPTGAQLEGVYKAISTIECQRDPGTVSGMKINDRDADGVRDGGEQGIAAWEITLSEVGGSVLRTVTTNADGIYTFTDVLPGSYSVCEVGKSGWRQTAPSTNNGCYIINVDAGATIGGKDFLNTESEKPECRDGKDNDGDLKADYPADPGCDDPEDNTENERPVITVTGANPFTVTLGAPYTDAGATAQDPEDGNITANIITGNPVNVTLVGTYTVTYNVTDSKGLSAIEKTRVVKVATACTDGKDNDGDGKTDFGGGDLGCENTDDNDENNKPVITVLGANPLNITVGGIFADPGATAQDFEDGDITTNLVLGGTVNTAVIGTYTITYDVKDSKNLSADQKSRVVNVTPKVTQCNDNIDNDGDGRIDVDGHIVLDMAFVPDAGCDSPEDDDENDRPVITVVGADPMTITAGAVWSDPSATVLDAEDGNITHKLVTSGVVNTSVLGTYVITYNATDSKNLSAIEKSRTVKVTSRCSDGLDNDQDGLADYPSDLGCDTPEDDSENDRPVITLVGDSVTITQGGAYTEQGATVLDKEDGDITTKLVIGGSVNTNVVGSYTITYNATDSQNLSAIEKTRTVNVASAGCTVNCGGGGTPPVCADGGDNDGDGLADYPRDPGCESSLDNDERDTGPTLTLVGGNPLTVTQGNSFTDPGATAEDPEEGNITSRIVVTGSVNTGTIGAYTLTYNVSDSQGHAATPVNRLVNVVSGGGGGGPAPLSIMNEKITSTGATTVVITWNTNLPATSRVAYGLDPVSSLGAEPLYGYTLSTDTNTTLTTSHSMTINDIPSAVSAYFRPVSTEGAQKAVGVELTRGGVLGDSECFYLREYLRLGYNNNPTEVSKLQAFLRNYEGFTTLPVTGFFDIATDKAVRTFQDKYAADVLTPWNLPSNTGYVYYTTQKKVNEIYCQRPFPLSAKQVDEVMKFRALVVKGAPTPANAVRTSETPRTTPVVTVTPITDEPGVVAGASTEAPKNVATPSTSKAPVVETERERGRVALADLLAANPKSSQELSGVKETQKRAPVEVTKTTDDVEVTPIATTEETDETDMTASVAQTGGACAQYSCLTIALGLLFLVILASLVYLYFKGESEHETTSEMKIN